MGVKINSGLLDPAEPSGRDDWWGVANGVTVLFRDAPHRNLRQVHLDVYIAMRAEAGCPDCISAVLECPTDPSLQAALKYSAKTLSAETMIGALKYAYTGK